MDSERADRLEDRYLHVHEAAEILDITEDKLWDLVHQHKVPTHNIAGAFLRFKKEDIEELKNKWRIERELFPKHERFFPQEGQSAHNSFKEALRDFWYFDDFYVLCSTLVAVLLYFIISSQ